MSPRPYASPARDAAAEETRLRLVAAATRLLRKSASDGVSLDAVAKAAGVTRLTVYNQFGSRRGLLEAVFDERAREGGLFRLADAVNLADPRAGLDRVIEIFCDFWSFDPSVGRLHLVADAEFKGAVAERNERRRKVIATLVRRMEGCAEDGAALDLVDTLFALTSYPMFGMLLVNGRSAADVRALIKAICDSAIACAMGAGNAQTQ
jgi:AcrR family transcriptional regulator